MIDRKKNPKNLAKKIPTKKDNRIQMIDKQHEDEISYCFDHGKRCVIRMEGARDSRPLYRREHRLA